MILEDIKELSVPYLTYGINYNATFMGKNVKELLPSLSIMVLAHAAFAFFSKFALGEVTLSIIPIAILSSLIGTKIGVNLSKKLSANTRDKLFDVIFNNSINSIISVDVDEIEKLIS